MPLGGDRVGSVGKVTYRADVRGVSLIQTSGLGHALLKRVPDGLLNVCVIFEGTIGAFVQIVSLGLTGGRDLRDTHAMLGGRRYIGFFGIITFFTLIENVSLRFAGCRHNGFDAVLVIAGGFFTAEGEKKNAEQQRKCRKRQKLFHRMLLYVYDIYACIIAETHKKVNSAKGRRVSLFDESLQK